MSSDRFGIVDGLLSSIDGLLQEAVVKVDDAVTAPIRAASSTLSGLNRKLDNLPKRILESSGELKDSLVQKILTPSEDQLRDNDSIVNNLIDQALGAVDQVLNQADQVLDDQVARIKSGVDVVVGAATDTVSELGEGFLTAVDELTAQSQELGRQLIEKVSSQAVQLREGLDSLVEKFGELATEGAATLRESISGAAEAVLGGFFDNLAPEATLRVDSIVSMIEDDPDTPEEIKAMLLPGALPLAVIGGFIAGMALPMIFASVANATMAPWVMKMQQNMMVKVRPSILPLRDAADAHRRNMMDLDRLTETAGKGGFTSEDILTVLELVKTRPGTLDLIDYWRRKLITNETLTSELTALGWDAEWRGVLERAAFPPPGVQDLITMAVREVFTPDVSAKFGIFDDFPPAFGELAPTVGLSQDWAENYWAAHWALPGAVQGFQMFQRTTEDSTDPDADTIALPSGGTIQNVIGLNSLELLLKAQDVMPFWRDKLIALAYRTFTRVDVRRMHALGVLDDDGVFRAYLDLGFDPDKAQRMLEFTVAFNARSTKVDARKERDLTKGDIIGLYNDKVIARPEAEALLFESGFDINESGLLLDREDMQELRIERKADIDLVVFKVRTGALTFDQGQDALNRLDPTEGELLKAQNAIERGKEQRSRNPTLNMVTDWWGIDLFDVAGLIEELRDLGFNDKHVLYLGTQLHLGKDQDQRRKFVSALRDADYGEEHIEFVRGGWARYDELQGRVTGEVTEVSIDQIGATREDEETGELTVEGEQNI